jgi:hypothetical protein
MLRKHQALQVILHFAYGFKWSQPQAVGCTGCRYVCAATPANVNGGSRCGICCQGLVELLGLSQQKLFWSEEGQGKAGLLRKPDTTRVSRGSPSLLCPLTFVDMRCCGYAVNRALAVCEETALRACWCCCSSAHLVPAPSGTSAACLLVLLQLPQRAGRTGTRLVPALRSTSAVTVC